ncbi:hypothetical protein ACI6QG_16860 [Roseococcus sp. DSY-14]|uniref:hypothetical protein n=1 Tax=Roseococcus sp. DSY-14 TaxID=3369650 RepID=UPI00387B72B0
MLSQSPPVSDTLLGIGFYTAAEAARLLRLPARAVNRWLGGYDAGTGEARRRHPPLWTPQLPPADGHLELGFRDMIELRFIAAFRKLGLPLPLIRRCIAVARDMIQQDHPFSTQRFKTDGRTIFLESMRAAGEERIIDLRNMQFSFRDVIAQTFKDLDIEDDAVRRWRPYRNKASIVIDPQRAFGQPIAATAGVPTIVLADAMKAEGSLARVSRLYEVAPHVVMDAIAFEETLRAA